jgi:flagellar protein FliS
LRDRYLTDASQTVSPGRLVVMLYDGLASDLARAEHALAAGDAVLARERLVRAQAIVLELLASLDLHAWAGAAGLAQVYVFLHRQLVDAHVGRDPARVATCIRLVEPLREAWTEALAEVAR